MRVRVDDGTARASETGCVGCSVRGLTRALVCVFLPRVGVRLCAGCVMGGKRVVGRGGAEPGLAGQRGAGVVESRGPSLVADDPGRGLGSGDPAPNDERPASSAEGLDGGVIGGKTRGREHGKYGKGGPVGNRGGTPKCGSLHDERRPSTSAIPSPESNNTDFPRNTLLPKVNIPRINSQYIPPSDKNTPYSSEDIPPSPEDTYNEEESILPIIENIPTPYPAPGTAQMQPRLGKRLGRNIDGKIIPHERDELIAHKISQWVAVGAGENEIAQFLNLRPGVLRKHYKFELTNGKFVNDMEVGETILDMAKSGKSERMTLLYAKARMGWRESDSNDSNNQALLNIHIHT